MERKSEVNVTDEFGMSHVLLHIHHNPHKPSIYCCYLAARLKAPLRQLSALCGVPCLISSTIPEPVCAQWINDWMELSTTCENRVHIVGLFCLLSLSGCIQCHTSCGLACMLCFLTSGFTPCSFWLKQTAYPTHLHLFVLFSIQFRWLPQGAEWGTATHNMHEPLLELYVWLLCTSLQSKRFLWVKSLTYLHMLSVRSRTQGRVEAQ